MSVAVVTGAGTGIGRAIAQALARKGVEVLAVGRRVEPLNETAASVPGIVPVQADVSTEEGRAKIGAEVSKKGKCKFLVHNAGTVEPVSPLKDLKLEEFRKTVAINYEAPVFLTQALLPFMEDGTRILHVSSGAAHGPMPSWTAYCTTKAAFFMFAKMCARELNDQGILCGSFKPGVVDTDMQGVLRAQSSENFPMHDFFKNLKSDEKLVAPADVGKFAIFLLYDMDKDEFQSKDHDIRDEELHCRWAQGCDTSKLQAKK